METVGSLIDKLSINELKIYHLSEQLSRNDVAEDMRENWKNKLSILERQRSDLSAELSGLLDDVMSGKKKLYVYRQMKMYNDKQFKD